MEELVKIYDEQNISLGIVEYESVVAKKSLWHRTVHICIYNTRGEIMLHYDKNCLNFVSWDIALSATLKRGADINQTLQYCWEKYSGKSNWENVKDKLKLWNVKIAEFNDGENIRREFQYIYFLVLDTKLLAEDLSLDKTTQNNIFLSIEELKKDLQNQTKQLVFGREYLFDFDYVYV